MAKRLRAAARCAAVPKRKSTSGSLRKSTRRAPEAGKVKTRSRVPSETKTASRTKTKTKTKIKATRKTPATWARKVALERTYTDELLANGRHRYERTPETVATIAADFGIHPGSLRRLAYRHGWVRFCMAPRGLPAAVRLVSEAGRLEAPPQALGVETGAADAGTDLAIIARLERQVVAELETVEAMRAQLKGLPRRPRAAETTARTLTALTDTLQKLRRLRSDVPNHGQNDDDCPADLDAFRIALANRIEAFLASRPDAGVDGDAAATPAADA